MFFVFPKLKFDGPTAFHLEQLIRQFRFRISDEISFIDSLELASGKVKLTDDNNVMFINWLDTLYFQIVWRRISIIFSFVIPHFLLVILADYYFNKLVKIFQIYHARDVRFIFYFHDKETFSRILLIQLIDRKFREYLYANCHQVIFAETSAQNEIKNIYRDNKNFQISCLGSYKDLFGHLNNKFDTRHRLGIPSSSTVILSFGTVRRTRRNREVINAVRKLNNLYYLGGGVGHDDIRESNIYSIGGFLSNERIVDFLSCADYVVHTGQDYLTSSVVRVAVSYQIPVIAEFYGATIDMCGDALQRIPKNICDYEIFLSKLPLSSSVRYKEMVTLLVAKDCERTWDIAAQGLVHAYEKCINKNL